MAETFKTYGYDTSGNKVNMYIDRNGKSYLDNGQRIPLGYTVQTNGGVFQMTAGGGVPVENHNRYIPNSNTNNSATSSIINTSQSNTSNTSATTGNTGKSIETELNSTNYINTLRDIWNTPAPATSGGGTASGGITNNKSSHKWYELTDANGNVIGSIKDLFLGPTLENNNGDLVLKDPYHVGTDQNGNSVIKESDIPDFFTFNNDVLTQNIQKYGWLIGGFLGILLISKIFRGGKRR
jgi:hypothetical protein